MHINNEELIGGKESTETESQNKCDDDDDKIQLRCELERQNSSPIISKLESSLVQTRFYTESHRRPNKT